MKNEQYLTYESKFTEPARKLLESLREQLVSSGLGPFSLIEQTDHDIDRGLEFHLESDPTFSVELRLTDGSEYGFEGVGLMLDCSAYLSGQVWAPGNFTESVGIQDPNEIEVRLSQCPVDGVVECIKAEWVRISDAQRDAERTMS